MIKCWRFRESRNKAWTNSSFNQS